MSSRQHAASCCRLELPEESVLVRWLWRHTLQTNCFMSVCYTRRSRARLPVADAGRRTQQGLQVAQQDGEHEHRLAADHLLPEVRDVRLVNVAGPAQRVTRVFGQVMPESSTCSSADLEARRFHTRLSEVTDRLVGADQGGVIETAGQTLPSLSFVIDVPSKGGARQKKNRCVYAGRLHLWPGLHLLPPTAARQLSRRSHFWKASACGWTSW